MLKGVKLNPESFIFLGSKIKVKSNGKINVKISVTDGLFIMQEITKGSFFMYQAL